MDFVKVDFTKEEKMFIHLCFAYGGAAMVGEESLMKALTEVIQTVGKDVNPIEFDKKIDLLNI